MFLFERIVGIIIYSIVLALFAISISRAKNMKMVKRYLIAYVVALAVMGYFYLPYISADLYRIRIAISGFYSNYNFRQIIDFVKNNRHGIHHLYYWVFGQLGNLNLLPAITATIFYSNVFYILYKCSKKFNCSPKVISCALVFFMAGGQFMEVISGIRSMLAFSIIALCCYKEFFEDKSFLSRIPLYIIAALMHDAALVLVIIRVMFLMFEPSTKNIVKIRNFSIMILFITFAFLFANQTIVGTFRHASNYVYGEVYSYFWEYIVATLCLVFMVYSMIKFSKIKKMGLIADASLLKCYNFVRIMLFIDIAFCFEYSIFQRYRTFIMIIILPIIIYIFSVLQSKRREDVQKLLSGYYRNYQLFFAITYIISMLRGNMTALKFFEL